MKTVYTKDLTGAALDWAVAAALNVQYKEDRVVKVCRVEATTPAWVERENAPGSAPYFQRFSPSIDWAQGGPIIEREGIDFEESGTYAVIDRDRDGVWTASGRNHLTAAMRCFVASKIGDTVQVPENLA